MLSILIFSKQGLCGLGPLDPSVLQTWIRSWLACLISSWYVRMVQKVVTNGTNGNFHLNLSLECFRWSLSLHSQGSLSILAILAFVLRKIARIAISRKQHFRSPAPPPLISCPTRWSLYWPLALCIDHLSILSTERRGTDVNLTQWGWMRLDVCSRRWYMLRPQILDRCSVLGGPVCSNKRMLAQ